MKNKDFGLKLIRRYHTMLLVLAKTLSDYKEMIREDDFMDIKWKCDVARDFVQVEKHAKEIIKKIKELREEYKCLDY